METLRVSRAHSDGEVATTKGTNEFKRDSNLSMTIISQRRYQFHHRGGSPERQPGSLMVPTPSVKDVRLTDFTSKFQMVQVIERRLPWIPLCRRAVVVPLHILTLLAGFHGHYHGTPEVVNRFLILFKVIVLAVSQLHAVPVRDHGGVIYGTEFLKVLDPRARLPLTENEAESPPSTSSRVSAALESSTSSTISSTSSSAVRSRVSPTTREKPRALNTLPLTPSSNDLKSIIKYGTKTTHTDISTIQRTKSQPSSIPNKEEISSINNTSMVSLSHDKNDTDSFLDYDYYYYYMDDHQLPSHENVSNSSAVKEAETDSFNISTTPFTLVQVTTAEPQKTSQTTTKPTESTISSTSKPVITRTTRARQTPTTSIPAISRTTIKSVTVRSALNPPTSRSPFRYQIDVTSESTTATSTTVVDKSSTQKTMLELDVTDAPAKIIQTTTETISGGRSNTRKLAEALRNLAQTTPPLQTTSQTPSVEDAVSATTTQSTTTTSEPLKPKVNSRQQRPSGQRNSTSRNFRYTTPLPKDEVASRDELVIDLNVNEETLQKSLGSATSSSVVVEVRVESPKPEARRMPAIKPQGSQTVGRNLQKGTPSPPKTVQTVDPEYRTTSFLLSDSLVVDLSSEPRTSDKEVEDSPSPQSRGQTSPRNSHTTTEKPKSTTPSQLEPESEKTITAAPSPRQGSSRAINAKSEASQIQATEIRLSDTDPKSNPEAKIINSANESESTTQNNDSSSKLTQTLRHSISTSVLRTVARTESKVSSVNAEKLASSPTTSEKPLSSTMAESNNITSVFNQTVSTNATTPLQKRSRPSNPHGIAPLGLAPFGEAPGGLAPFGYAPEGAHPYGLDPIGLHPHGVSPHGDPKNLSTNATETTQNTRVTFVDATVSEGANSSVGYVAVEHNVSRFRLEEKTPDGFIIGEYGEVDHRTGDVNGVRYTADSTADPNLIYGALLKFLNL
ncbi:mucin-2-like [Palaemon carinicauda]|uniref:mucin-2-like n=1 Tax=Palaemon carinicauda TaxID=392227 RepID=UPI0035B5D5E9